MLEKLRIRNFKGWKDTGDIRMAPITLFFGANSSGKSSIGQFLMMLKQTVESPDRKAVFYPGGRNSAVQLGSYQEMVFHRDPKNKIAFEYLWSLPEDMEIKDPLSGDTFSGNRFEFNAEVGIGDTAEHSLHVSRMKYRLLSDGENDTSPLSVGLTWKSGNQEYIASANPYVLVKQKERKWALKDIVRFYGFPDETAASYQNSAFVQELNFIHESLFHSIYYLGPLRTKTERLYTWSGVTPESSGIVGMGRAGQMQAGRGISPESVGFAGENTVNAIITARSRKINLIKPGAERVSPAKPFEEVIVLKLKEIGLIEEFHVNRISENRQEYEVKVRTRGSKDFVDLPDVGFGVSQVLPVLVQCFYAPPGSIIIMEQPEIHLHPSAQSALADVMIDVINSRENGEERGIQLIIETHSEHFLRRLQRRIAEDKVSRDKVSTYFADITKTPAALDPLEIDEFGNIRNWPENFFGDEMGDITGQAKAAMKKRMQESDNPETP